MINTSVLFAITISGAGVVLLLLGDYATGAIISLIGAVLSDLSIIKGDLSIIKDKLNG